MVEVVTVKFPLSSIALAVSEIAPADEMPEMLFTVPTVKVALLVTVSEAMPVAARVLNVFEVLLRL